MVMHIECFALIGRLSYRYPSVFFRKGDQRIGSEHKTWGGWDLYFRPKFVSKRPSLSIELFEPQTSTLVSFIRCKGFYALIRIEVIVYRFVYTGSDGNKRYMERFED